MNDKLKYYGFFSVCAIIYSLTVIGILNQIFKVLPESYKYDEDFQLFVFILSMILAITPFALIVLGIKISEKIVKRK